MRAQKRNRAAPRVALLIALFLLGLPCYAQWIVYNGSRSNCELHVYLNGANNVIQSGSDVWYSGTATIYVHHRDTTSSSADYVFHIWEYKGGVEQDHQENDGVDQNFFSTTGDFNISMRLDYYKYVYKRTGGRGGGYYTWVKDDSWSASRTFYNDSTKPSISISGPSGSITGNATFSAGASDDRIGVNAGSWRAGVDGADWGNTSAVTVTSEGNHTITFYVADYLGNQSSATSYVTIDRTPPVISAADVGPAAQATTLYVEAGATDNLGLDANSWQYRVDDGAWSSAGYGNRKAPINTEGRHKVDFTVRDNAGNAATKTVYATLDRSGPTITAADIPWTSTASAVVTASAVDTFAQVDEKSWEYSVGEGWNGPGSVFKTATLSEEGESTVQFRVKDSLGNLSVSRPVSVKIDRTGPELTAADTQWTNGPSATLTASATDPLSGLNPDGWQYRVDGGAWSSMAGANNSVRLTEEGGHTVTFRARDIVGNVSEASAKVRIDRSGPTISLPDAPWTNLGVVTAAATDPHSGVDASSWRYKIDDGEWSAAGGANRSVILTDEGTHMVSFRVSDIAGNVAERSTTVRLDLTPPEIAASDLPWTKAASVAASASASDTFSGINDVSWKYRIDGGAWSAEAAANRSVNVSAEGTHRVDFQVRDQAGNAVEKSMLVRLDRTGPTISASDVTWTQIASPAADASDALSGLDPGTWKYKVDGGPWSEAGVANNAFSISTEGVHTVVFHVEDIVGNASEKTLTARVDTTPPVIAAGDLAWTAAATATLSASATDARSAVNGASWRYRVDGGPWSAEASANNVVTLGSEGEHTVTFQVRDVAGNVAEKAALVRLDHSGPEIAASDIAWTDAASVIAFAGATDALSGVNTATWQHKVDGGAWSAASTGADRVTVSAEGVHEVTFRVADSVGNVSERTATVRLDHTPPVITASDTAWSAAASVTVSASAADGPSGVNEASWRHRIDDGAWTQAGNANKSVSVSAEGTHTVTFQVLDIAGNATEKTVAVKLDRTGPSISVGSGGNGNIFIRADGEDYGPDRYLETQTPILRIVRSLSDGTEEASPVDKYEYAIQRNKAGTLNAPFAGTRYVVDVPAANEADASYEYQFPFGLFSDGTNYLYIRAVDAVGNAGTPIERVVRIDTMNPGAPMIKSATHPPAAVPEDAVAESTAVFTLSSTTGGALGLSGYQWELHTAGATGTGTLFEFNGKAVAGSVAIPRIELYGLPDNGVDLFYVLMTRAVGGNGRTGGWAAYRFRVDTAAPTELRVVVRPQVQADAWYGDPSATISWRRPRDLTGVKSYKYRLSTSPTLIPANARSDYFLSSEWQNYPTPDDETSSVTVSMASILGATGAKTGTVYAVVASADTAGNVKWDSAEFRYDLESPTVTNVTAGIYEDGLIGSVGPVGDGAGSGVASRELRLLEYKKDAAGDWKTIERTSYAAMADGEASLVFPGLENGVYAVQVRVTDAGGNAQVLSSGAVAIGGGEVPQKVARSFEYTANSFIVRGTGELDIASGKWNFDPAKLALILPDSYPFGSLSRDGTWATVASLAPVSVTGERPEELELSFAGTYRFPLDYFTLSGSNPVFNVKKGFSWDSISYVPSGSTSVTYGSAGAPISIGLPPDESISGSPSVPHGASFMTIAKSVPAETTPLWRLLGIEGQTSSYFAGSYWQLRNSRIQDTASGDRGFFKRNSIMLKTAQLDGRPLLVGGLVAENTQVTLGGVSYVIEESYIEGPYLKVKSAYIPLDPDSGFIDADQRISLRNILIASDGRVTLAPDFWSESIRYELVLADGTIVVVETGENSLSFIPGGEDGDRVVINGAALTVPGVGTVMAASGIPFNANGLVLDGSAAIANFSGLVHGYTVTSAKATLVESGIALETAELELSPYTEQTVTLTGLILAYGGYGAEGYAVARIGSWSAGNASTVAFGAPYGAGVAARYIEVNADGVSGSMEVVLPAALGGEAKVFTQVPLPKSGTYGRSATIANLSVGPAGFSGSLKDAQFNGSTVKAENLDIVAVAGTGGIELRFALPVVDAEGWTSRENPKTTLVKSYTHKTWNFDLSTFTLNLHDISCPDAKLNLPKVIGAGAYIAEGAKFTGTGVFVPGNLASDSYALIGGWFVDLAGATIAEDASLLDSEASVQLHASMGEGAFLFPNLAIASSGSVKSCGLGSAELPFIAENGFTVVAKDYRIGDGGITSGGRINFPSAFGADVFATYVAGEIAINADGSVTTERKDTDPVPFHFGSLALQAEGYWFTREGLTASSLTATVSVGGNEVKFGLPETSFYSDGTIRSGGRLVQGFEKELFGFTFSVTETRLVDDGLRLKSFVRLPESLDAHELYFDALTLHPDGSITTDIALDRFRFGRGGLEFDLRDIRFYGADGISIGEAVVTLPEKLQRKTIRMTGVGVSADGDFTLGNLSADPVELWGFTFYFNSLSILDGMVDLDGAVCLPSTFPSAIASKTIDIADFRYSMKAEDVVSFKVAISEALVFPIIGDWVVTAEGVSVVKQGDGYLLSIDRGTLDFPPNFLGDDLQVSSAQIAGIKIDPADGAFSFDSVTMSDVQVRKFGCDFTLTSLSVSGDFDFRFAGSVALPTDNMSLPPFLRGKTIAVRAFEILSDGNLGDIDGSIAGLSGTAFGAFLVDDCTIGFKKKGGDFYLSASEGTVRLGSTFPAGIDGKELNLSELTVRLNDLAVESFSAQARGLTFDLFGQARVANADFGLVKTANDFELSITNANVVLTGPAFSAGLKNERLSLNMFKMDSSGRILDFDAGLSVSQRRALFADVYFAPLVEGTPAYIRAALNTEKTAVVFSLSGSLEFGSSFIPSLRGTKCAITTLQFDTGGSLLAVDAAAALPDVSMFGLLTLRSGTIGITKEGSSDLGISVAGRLRLPEVGAPQGLGGKELVISSFKIETDGNIKDIQASIAGPKSSDRITMFAGLKLLYWNISVAGRNGDNLSLSITGDVVLPSTLPGYLAETRLRIAAFTFSSASMTITQFDATLQPGSGSISIPVFAGIQTELTRIHLTKEFFSMSGSMTLPSTFIPGLAGRTVAIDNLEMDWNGRLRKLQAGIAAVDTKILGFSVALRSLSFGTEGISVASASLTLPSSLDGRQLALRDVRIDTTGQFSAAFVLPSISFNVGGFTLVLEQPRLDYANEEIGFSSVQLKTPSIMQAMDIYLYGVGVRPNGLRISGAGFDLPTFDVGDGMRFALSGHLQTGSDGKYFVSAAGQAFIPGAGWVEAEASFVNASRTYPIGLAYAKFKYTVWGLGLPIANTGLFMNSISGSLGFGYPYEIPAAARKYFDDDGIRIGIGVGVQDGTYGNIIRGNANLWIDVVNAEWAFKGDMTVLNGLVKTDMLSFYAGGVFSAQFHFRIFIVNGEVQIWIWQEGGDPKLSGRAEAEFVIERGQFFNEKILGVRIRIPPWTITLGGGGVEFGQFKRNKVGIKGWIDLPIIGDVGVFVSRSGGIDFTHIDEYELYIPAGRRNITGAMRAAQTGNAAERVTFRNDVSLDSPGAETYQFRVPESDGTGSFSSSRRMSQRAVTRGLRADEIDIGEDTEVPDSGAERLIFALAYEEGDPRLVAIAPSGKEYKEGDPEVLIQRADWGLMMAVFSSEAGEWSTRVENLPTGLQYALQVFGKAAKPEIELKTPADSGEAVDSTYVAKGRIAMAGSGAVELYVSTEQGAKVGRLAGTVTPTSDGQFELPIDLSGYPEGTYYVYASVDDEEGIATVTASAPGSLTVTHAKPLAAPLTPRIGEKDDGSIVVFVEDSNGRRSAGHFLYVDAAGLETEKLDLGSIDNFRLPRLITGTEYRITAAAYDAIGNVSARSEPAVITIGAVKPRYNEFAFSSDKLAVSLTSGSQTNASVPYNVAAPVARGDAFDRMLARVVSGPEWLAVKSPEKGYDVSIGSGSAEFTIGSITDPAAGTYEAVIAFENMGNREVRKTLALTIDVTYPAPSIEAVRPESMYSAKPEEILVGGSGFIAGTSLKLDGVAMTNASVSPNVILFTPPAGLSGGTHTVTVVGPGGAVSSKLEVLAPYYGLEFAASRAAVTAGESCVFPYEVKAENEFSGNATIQATDIPDGWNVTFSPLSVPAGARGAIEVHVPAGASTGTSLLAFKTNQGDTFKLSVEVTAAAPEPTILSLTPYAAIAGETVTINGYGFGSAGKIFLGGKAIASSSWKNYAVTFAVPTGAASGQLAVESGGRRSAEVSFVVMSEGFTLYPEVERLTLQPGETANVSVSVAGAKRLVNLTPISTDESIVAKLSAASVLPNARTVLTITADANAGSGERTVSLRGTSGTVLRQVDIVVNIGNVFEVTTASLPVAMELGSYRTELASVNGKEPLAWSIAEGSLPAGLSLSTKGVIAGTPTDIGEKTFTVRATDKGGRKADKKFTLKIEENAWSQQGRDGGGSGYNATSVPATADLAWTSDEVASAGSDRLITGGKRVFAYGSGGLTAYDKSSGRAVYRLSGGITRAAYTSETLFTLGADGTLAARDAAYGYERWKVENTAAFALDGAVLYVSDGSRTTTYQGAGSDELVAGSRLDEYSGAFAATDVVFFAKGALHRVNGKSLEVLEKTGWRSKYQAAGELKAGAWDGNRFLLATSTVILELDDTYGLVTGYAVDGGAGSINVSANAIVATTANGGTIIDRRTGGARAGIGIRGRYALGDEKLIASSAAKLSVLNVYRGSEIWSSAGALDAVAASGRVYSLGTDRKVRCYTGLENAVPPVTPIAVTPAAPDGVSGWYKTLPTMALPATDKETYAASTRYRFGDGDWMSYRDPIVLREGAYPIAATSTDSHGYAENTVSLNVKVDATAPVTRHAATVTPGNPGWSLTGATLSLTSTDTVSGIDAIEYRYNGGEWKEYRSEFSFGAEGPHAVEYRGRDRAGNVSGIGSWAMAVDLYEPTVEAAAITEAGLGAVYLTAKDSGSGVARIEYKSDGGTIAIYRDPVVLTGMGLHKVEYRAIDVAGRISAWKTITVVVPEYETGRLILDMRFFDYISGRRIVKKAAVGMPLYGKADDKDNKIDALPGYVLGSDQIRLSVEDRWSKAKTLGSFTAGDDVTVYYFKHAASSADMDGWTSVATKYPVENQKYFIGGATIYGRSYVKGERVLIPGPGANGKGYAPLVFVQKTAASTVRVTTPAAGTTLAPLAVVRMTGAALGKAAEGTSFRWSASFTDAHEGGNPVTLAVTADGGPYGGASVALPYTPERGKLTVMLEFIGMDGKRIGQHQRTLAVVNGASIELYEPAPGSTLVASQAYALKLAAKDLRGEEVDASNIEWSASGDGKTWSSAPISGGILTAPTISGPFNLKAVWPEGVKEKDGSPRTRERVWQFKVAEDTAPVAIGFGGERQGMEPSRGEVFSARTSGKEYGFSVDHQQRVRSFRATRVPQGKLWSPERNETYVALAEGEKFIAKVGVGRVKARLLLGPFWKKGAYDLNVEGSAVAIPVGRGDEEIWEVELEATCADGLLEITGSVDLPFIEATFERLGEDAPSVETTVKERSDIRVLGHEKHWEKDAEKQGPHKEPGRDDDKNEWGLRDAEWD